MTAFRAGGQGLQQGHDLSVNLYYPRIQESCEVVITAAEMGHALGRSAFDLEDGEPRTTAIEWLCRRLQVSVKDDPVNPNRKIMAAKLHVNKDADWLSAYKLLDTAAEVSVERIEGVPMKFIPSKSRGDLILRKGLKINGAGSAMKGIRECLVSVYSRAAGEAPGHGLVFECYNPDTAYTSILHVEASELRRQVNHREELLGAAQIKDTVESLLYRLVLMPSPVGGLSLSLDSKLLPNLFD